MNGDVSSVYALLASRLQADWKELPDQDALDIAAVLHQAKLDEETTWLIKKMKDDDNQIYQDFAADTTPQETVKSLQTALHELRAMDVLFRDPERAFQELQKEGLIPPDKVKMYEKDKELLEADFRKQMYFMLVSYAAAGGYL